MVANMSDAEKKLSYEVSCAPRLDILILTAFAGEEAPRGPQDAIS